MIKEDGDLRDLIERKMAERDHCCGPFSKEVGEEIMYRVVEGMDELHKYDIIHRDLKASNVLVKTDPMGKWHWCIVADFESSIGVVGTGFWRAPEILRALREKNVGKRPELFSREADSYSYGMTCYEVLTGLKPFEEVQNCNVKAFVDEVLQGRRPTLPRDLQPWMVDLMNKCWHMDPLERPTIDKIFEILDVLPRNKTMFLKSMDDNYRHC